MTWGSKRCLRCGNGASVYSRSRVHTLVHIGCICFHPMLSAKRKKFALPMKIRTRRSYGTAFVGPVHAPQKPAKTTWRHFVLLLRKRLTLIGYISIVLSVSANLKANLTD